MRSTEKLSDTFEYLSVSWNLTKFEFEHIFVISTSNYNSHITFHFDSDNFDLNQGTLLDYAAELTDRLHNKRLAIFRIPFREINNYLELISLILCQF